MRQTNIIWVILITIEDGLNFVELKARKPLSRDVRNSPKYVQVFIIREFYLFFYSILIVLNATIFKIN